MSDPTDIDGIEMLRALADELETERANVEALLLAVRNARAGTSSEKGNALVPLSLWLKVCKALKKFE